jgi:hypothetical protein
VHQKPHDELLLTGGLITRRSQEQVKETSAGVDTEDEIPCLVLPAAEGVNVTEHEAGHVRIGSPIPDESLLGESIVKGVCPLMTVDIHGPDRHDPGTGRGRVEGLAD